VAIYFHDGLTVYMNEHSQAIKISIDTGANENRRSICIVGNDSKVTVAMKGGLLLETITVSRDAGFKLSHRAGPEEA
jgi:hypothetical protein